MLQDLHFIMKENKLFQNIPNTFFVFQHPQQIKVHKKGNPPF